MARSKSNHYLNNNDLREQAILSQKLGEPTPRLLKMFELLGTRILRKFYYETEQDRDDCFQSGYINLLKNIKNYKSEFPNAFAYFTQVFKTGAAKGWNDIHPKASKHNISIEAGLDGGDGESGLHSL